MKGRGRQRCRCVPVFAFEVLSKSLPATKYKILFFYSLVTGLDPGLERASTWRYSPLQPQLVQVSLSLKEFWLVCYCPGYQDYYSLNSKTENLSCHFSAYVLVHRVVNNGRSEGICRVNPKVLSLPSENARTSSF